ncbi:MAG: YmdB family metallophosphoesterase, partial [Pseudomonadota bacterium]|nr:YmdB family metallophosphoesterase [Pseudomonadota bacterium]
MKILFLGDVVGRAAREAVVRQVPLWRKQWALDFVIVNGENAAGGFGITSAIA